MAHFKKWLDGEQDLFNKEIEPSHLEKNELSYEEFNKALDNSISGREKQVLVKKETTRFNVLYLFFAIITFAIYVSVLIYNASCLEIFGDVNTGWNYVAKYYIANGLTETRSVNSVTGMILDYRAFDTLGESFVLFTAVTCVFILLHGFNDDESKIEPKSYIVHRDPIVKYAGMVLVPVIFLFGIYVVLNGHLSPGGGFSGGAILGAGLILFSLSFGSKVFKKFFTLKTFRTISAIALSGYAITKCYSFFMGGMHVQFPEYFHDPIAAWFHSLADGSILSGGYILILNMCVGAVVACTMYAFYSLFKKGEI